MIAEGAGVSIGSVYAHFEDKIEIFLEILAAHSEAVYRYSEAQVSRIVESNEEPGTALDWLVPGMYRLVQSFLGQAQLRDDALRLDE